ncbi:sigma-54 dependent transcriptional regulator [Aestuariirhabdus sp. Z084]|uniref:sigma-54-dependent transcriptional regulator n=1 Tax=Aestuariirhabdus haliotis TaxID=2918751 RepID=UPI00201B45F9|nr:sigma-54 dependent transcriptional regulator [Aestuariirhabdus haliotis]MCL6416550.1 sigma-54 dependent transcriptional regulator [Aestuariirhabdus haliotis]MCL6420583.1 sigma-54 dependent transcriptional regulator [Aestuariirhabdus haliotis]
MTKRLLIVDDDVAICRMLELHFGSEGFSIELAHSVEQGLQACEKFLPHVIVLDIRMGGESGLIGLLEFKARWPDTRVIMITAFHDMDSTIQAMQGGADDYIHKPIDLDELQGAVNQALASRDVQNDASNGVLSPPDHNLMVGRSQPMRTVFKTIGRVSGNGATVLITGESGTGKELVAKAIHKASKQSSGPFVAINCAALVDTLLESEMFGHERGAFSGAVSAQPGKFMLAQNGTLFLDEVGELSPAIQAKLLRVLQEREFTPLGSKRSHESNARIIAATNVDLAEAVEHHKFRSDLFYRLEVVSLELPSLRDRLDDLEDLVPVLLHRINALLGTNVTSISQSTMAAFRNYEWPGNVRELENVLTKSVALAPGDCITRDLLSDTFQSPAAQDEESLTTVDQAQKSLRQIELEHVYRVMEFTDGHKGRACEILGISRPRLQRLLQQSVAEEN